MVFANLKYIHRRIVASKIAIYNRFQSSLWVFVFEYPLNLNK